MRDEMTVWAWYCDKPHGGYLFHGNPNADIPYYHLGSIRSLLVDELVYANTRRGLLQRMSMREWNKRLPQFRVKPVRVTVAIERVQKAKGGKAK